MQAWRNLGEILERELARPDLIRVLPGEFENRIITFPSDELIEAICALPEAQQIEGTMFCIGGMAVAMNAVPLCEGLILRARRSNCAEAIEALAWCLRSDTLYTEIALIAGISVREKIELSDGYCLCPPDQVPSQEFQQRRLADEQRFGFDKFGFTDRRKVGAALLRTRTNKRFCQPDKVPASDDQALAQIVALLALVGPSSPIAYRIFNELDDNDILKGVTGGGFFGNRDETRVVKNVELDRLMFDDFKDVVAKYRLLSEKDRAHIAVPLHRLNESVRHQSEVDMALDLGIALESILRNDNDKEQLTLQFRLRGAWLLGDDGDHRAALFQQFGDIYTLRSQAAHKGILSTKKGTTPAAVISGGQKLCAEAIKRIILKGGFPDWRALLIGADYALEEKHSPAGD
jgi:hypothetical protein